MFMCPVAGVLSDRINRKKLLLVTEIAYSICLFSHVFVANLAMLFVMRAIPGIFFAISSVLTVAYASNYIPHNKMGEGLGYFGLVTPLVQAAAPSIGLGLRDSVGYGAAFIGAAVAAGIALICVVVLPYEDISTSESTLDTLDAVVISAPIDMAYFVTRGTVMYPAIPFPKLIRINKKNFQVHSFSAAVFLSILSVSSISFLIIESLF